MIIIDRREKKEGSKNNDIEESLCKLGVPVIRDTLEIGDLSWAGYGPDETNKKADPQTMVICERKRLQDLVNCVRDRRLSGFQLQKISEMSDFAYLIVEGAWRSGPGGEILEYKYGWDSVLKRKVKEWAPLFGSTDRHAVSYRMLASYLHSIALRLRTKSRNEPIRIIRTGSADQTAAEVAALYYGWTDKLWGEHHSHDEIYTAITQPKPGLTMCGTSGQTKVKRVTIGWKMAAQFEGIDRKAESVMEHFRSIKRMVNASVDDWCEIKGIGKKIAQRCVDTVDEDSAPWLQSTDGESDNV